MSKDIDFTWIDFYKKFAKKLKAYKDNQEELVKKINDVCKEAEISFNPSDYKDGIDPFTVFSLFNKKIKDAKRRNFIKAAKKHFEIQASETMDFHGIPLCLNQNARFGQGQEQITLLWSFFIEALNHIEAINSGENKDFSEEFEDAFNKAIGIPGNGTGKITMALYWIDPDVFVNLDSFNVSYICDVFDDNEVLQQIESSDKIDAKQYKTCLDALRNFVKEKDEYRTFAKFSHEANNFADRNSIKQLLLANGQVILHGAPGTGKTYTAKEVARDITHDENKIVSIEFHPGYDYSDFIIGLKPIIVSSDKGKAVSFEWKPGLFKKWADEARKALDEYARDYEGKDKFNPPKFVLIIDEINRANLSDVFGEVFSSMERGYRYRIERNLNGSVKFEYEEENNGRPRIDSRGNPILKRDADGKPIPVVMAHKIVTLPGTIPDSDKPQTLVVPENLYIIGTMNDIDRSVETIDFALRRRFVWKEIAADDSKCAILEKCSGGKRVFESRDYWKLSNAMDALNEAIENVEWLNRSYELGAAYFANLDLYRSNSGRYPKEAYESLWNNHLAPILKEYLRGKDTNDEIFKSFRNAYKAGLTEGDKSE